MNAIVYQRYGSPDVLELKDVQKPMPGPGEVLVKVHAASVNAADKHLLRGQPFPVRMMAGFFKPKNNILGADMAGEVESVGKGVSYFKPGDKVFGELSAYDFGAFAAYVAVSEKALAHMPSNALFGEAAALPMAAVTALQGLRDKGQISPGKKVLINGASGGVGTFAVQIAKAFGAEVTAVASTGKTELAKILGADHTIDYKLTDFTKGGERYDLIFDVVGNHSVSALKRVLNKHGRYVTTAFSPGAMFLGPWIAIAEGKKIINMLASANRKDLEAVRQMVDGGEVRPVVERSYPLADVAKAISYMEEGHPFGKIVIQVQ
ncbi:NAD(P)-dependent alcohol dehydrogenase [Imperialibacter roseus]|uniref:NAD(P)-dependent alcohol dehydrogenase n=1 Tax=Imperialibacter roseus TaxID=1324217 RepID=A0ABZ0ISB2_9BACT|nr:NAD(P)-dependent alcohol dehydrogenase [Imperialibacter roseus]WOK07328.1 NAD(P)-dependent alcohol dehydrogenase [Imperialibacter roseus]